MKCFIQSCEVMCLFQMANAVQVCWTETSLLYLVYSHAAENEYDWREVAAGDTLVD